MKPQLARETVSGAEIGALGAAEASVGGAEAGGWGWGAAAYPGGMKLSQASSISEIAAEKNDW